MNKRTSNTLYIIGLILLLAGALGITIFAYFLIIGAPIFLIGIIVILISKKPLKQKLIPIAIYIIWIIAFWPIWTKMHTVGPEAFLIPNDYRGKINVVFKKGCGSEIEKSNGGFIYRIPENGILILNAKQKFGFINHTYYLVDKNGKRTELPKMDVRDFNEEWTREKNPNEPDRDQLGVYNWGTTGSIGRNIDSDGNVTNEDDLYTYIEFYVSSYNDLTQKYGFRYQNEFEILREKEIENCKQNNYPH